MITPWDRRACFARKHMNFCTGAIDFSSLPRHQPNDRVFLMGLLYGKEKGFDGLCSCEITHSTTTIERRNDPFDSVPLYPTTYRTIASGSLSHLSVQYHSIACSAHTRVPLFSDVACVLVSLCIHRLGSRWCFLS